MDDSLEVRSGGALERAVPGGVAVRDLCDAGKPRQREKGKKDLIM